MHQLSQLACLAACPAPKQLGDLEASGAWPICQGTFSMGTEPACSACLDPVLTCTHAMRAGTRCQV